MSLHRTVAFGLVLAIGWGGSERVAHATAPSFTNDRARKLYDEGIEKFDAEDFEGALEELRASVELERTPPALYALAQTLNKLDRCEDAVPIYEEVHVMLPKGGPAAAAVEEALRVCADRIALDPEPEPESESESESESDSVSESEPEPEPEPESAWYEDVPAPILLGVGLVGVGVGGAFLGRAAGLDPEGASDYGAFETEREEQLKLRITGGAILGVGGALVIGGVIRYIVVARKLKAEDAGVSVTPTLGPRWGGASVQGRF